MRSSGAESWEINAIRGRGKLSSSHVLRNIAAKSKWKEVFEAAAEYIEELEDKVKEDAR